MSNMVLQIIEECDVEDQLTTGIRKVLYESDKENLLEALNDYENNFNSDRVIESEDFFDGTCMDSEIIEVRNYHR